MLDTIRWRILLVALAGWTKRRQQVYLDDTHRAYRLIGIPVRPDRGARWLVPERAATSARLVYGPARRGRRRIASLMSWLPTLPDGCRRQREFARETPTPSAPRAPGRTARPSGSTSVAPARTSVPGRVSPHIPFA